ncbi:MAG: BrnT family toxin [Gemmatimonadota bacterium]|nr:BrnT family toxin [Gemmatimonadota bacterium]
MALQFAWDPGKAAANLSRHGVSFEEASTAFGDPHSITIPDPEHSQSEQRFILIGASLQGLLVIVSHAERGDTIRIISARRATRTERRTYEEAW